MPEEGMEGQIDLGSKGEVGDLSDVARGFLQNVTAKGLAVLCQEQVGRVRMQWATDAVLSFLLNVMYHSNM